MPEFGRVTRAHVLEAIGEYDARGADDFLNTYGYDRAREYLLWHGGRAYDSKAILGVAHKYATGVAANSDEFEDGRDGATKHLGGLDFEVIHAAPPQGHGAPITGAWIDASELGDEETRVAWAEAARAVLIDAAGNYRTVISYRELATQVMLRTGIHTRQLLHYWIGDVLRRVSAECARRGEPLLSSLCVNADGSVGESYTQAVIAATGEPPLDGDDHAAKERLACHTFFGADDLPADGGSAALTPKLAASRQYARKVRLAEQPTVKCPTCFMELPSTGVCNYCD